MTVYNGEQTLAEVIESITSQTFTDFELIIFDDGSLDASAKVVQRCAEQDSRIRFFPLERNVGRGDAFNVGFFAAQGAYITSMDCDDICLPQRLKNQVEFMDAHSEVGALGTGFRAVYVDQDRMPYDRFMPSSHALILLSMHYRLALCAASVMYRLELLRSVGGITPGTRELQDFDLQFKMIWEARTVFANLPETLYIYRIDDESLSEIDARNGSPRRIAMWRAMLERLQVDDRENVLASMSLLNRGATMSRAERGAAKRALYHISERLIERRLVDRNDQTLLHDEIENILSLRKKPSSRLWQKSRYWLRHRFSRKINRVNPF